jgi:hypothetical protein
MTTLKTESNATANIENSIRFLLLKSELASLNNELCIAAIKRSFCIQYGIGLRFQCLKNN